uniref:Uncharacterized protein n=1 Tax=Arundo donax TaxID=35708 RepID=A0A0A9GFQ1_ARUDO
MERLIPGILKPLQLKMLDCGSHSTEAESCLIIRVPATELEK